MIRGIVAVVGRPNVGKSTLFNKLTHSRAAIVHDRPGVTRDRIYGTVWLDDNRENGFTLIDTGGFTIDQRTGEAFPDRLVWEQTKIAIAESDVVILIVDGKSGLHPLDKKLAATVREAGKPIVFAVNKVDAAEAKDGLWEFCELAADVPLAISAEHKRGLDELIERVHLHLHAREASMRASAEPGAARIALIGRPNVGKSSILNRLIGEERSLVTPIAGTTRDSIDTPFTFNRKPYILIDTAGMRRRAKIDDKIESISVIRSLSALEQADVVLVVLDAVEGLTDQDARLADLAWSQGRPLALIVNKWDLVEGKKSNSARDYEDNLHRSLQTLGPLPVLFVSCKTNQRVHKIMSVVEELSELRHKRADTAKVNKVLERAAAEHTPALNRTRGGRVKFFYATQIRTAPPTFVVFCNYAAEIAESYKRYLMTRFRDELGFGSVPLQLIFRNRTESENHKKR